MSEGDENLGKAFATILQNGFRRQMVAPMQEHKLRPEIGLLQKLSDQRSTKANVEGDPGIKRSCIRRMGVSLLPEIHASRAVPDRNGVVQQRRRFVRLNRAKDMKDKTPNLRENSNNGAVDAADMDLRMFDHVLKRSCRQRPPPSPGSLDN